MAWELYTEGTDCSLRGTYVKYSVNKVNVSNFFFFLQPGVNNMDVAAGMYTIYWRYLLNYCEQ